MSMQQITRHANQPPRKTKMNGDLINKAELGELILDAQNY
jgi:hypothetical protein